jgi:hypothetical protein
MSQRMNQQLVRFLAPKLRQEIGFTTPIFFHVFLIIRLFGFIPADFRISTRRHYKAVKITILKRVLCHHLYEAGCSGHYQMHKWWDNSQPLHRHQFLITMHNFGYFKPMVFKLLFSTAKHGFSNSKFHELCDKKGPTMMVFTLNGKTVVAILNKSWNVLDCGWNLDPDLKLFFVHNDGTTTELECTYTKEKLQYYNDCLSGPHFCGLPINFRSKHTEVHFWQRELITGGPQIYNASIDSVVVLQMGGTARSPLTPPPIVLQTRNCHIVANGGNCLFPPYPPMVLQTHNCRIRAKFLIDYCCIKIFYKYFCYNLANIWGIFTPIQIPNHFPILAIF